MTIRLCCGLVAVAKDGLKRIGGSTGVTAGAPKASTVKQRLGTGSRAVRRGLANMKIQAYLTAAAIDLKRLAAAILALLLRWLVPGAHSGPQFAQEFT
jgi:hypothetical protein